MNYSFILYFSIIYLLILSSCKENSAQTKKESTCPCLASLMGGSKCKNVKSLTESLDKLKKVLSSVNKTREMNKKTLGLFVPFLPIVLRLLNKTKLEKLDTKCSSNAEKKVQTDALIQRKSSAKNMRTRINGEVQLNETVETLFNDDADNTRNILNETTDKPLSKVVDDSTSNDDDDNYNVDEGDYDDDYTTTPRSISGTNSFPDNINFTSRFLSSEGGVNKSHQQKKPAYNRKNNNTSTDDDNYNIDEGDYDDDYTTTPRSISGTNSFPDNITFASRFLSSEVGVNKSHQQKKPAYNRKRFNTLQSNSVSSSENNPSLSNNKNENPNDPKENYSSTSSQGTDVKNNETKNQPVKSSSPNQPGQKSDVTKSSSPNQPGQKCDVTKSCTNKNCAHCKDSEESDSDESSSSSDESSSYYDDSDEHDYINNYNADNYDYNDNSHENCDNNYEINPYYYLYK